MHNNSKSMNSDIYISSAWQQHADLITHLCHFSQNILLVLGVEGAGKTAFFEHFTHNPGPGLKVCALTADPNNTVEELLKEVATGFDLNWESADSTTLQVQTQAIAAYQKAHETWMLIIDDAHKLDDVQMAALLQLVQFNDEARQQLHLVLVGESSLESRLFSSNLATWAQG
ncbi:MAG TPA: ATP-binding protein, partial [Methylotenera sp.]|nr:ATP-binding protein [Methylotenera sp.]